VTLICVAMVVGAVAVVCRLWNTRRVPTPATRAMPFQERLAITTGRTAGMITGAAVAGVIVIGAGGRLLMRVLAVTSPDAQGAVTDAEEVVGEVSVGGSVFLIGLVGLGAGLLGLVIFVGLRRWLPRRSTAAGVLGAAIGAGLLVRPSKLLSPDNPDFSILTPRALAVGMCVGILVLFALTFGPLVDLLAARWPRPSLSVLGVASLLPFVLLVALSVAAPAVLLTMFATAWLGPISGAAAAEPAQNDGNLKARPVDRLGRIAVFGLAALGGAVVLVSAGQILAG